MGTPPSRRTGAIVLVAALAAIAILTLWPAAVTQSLGANCIFCGPQAGVDFALNIVLFVPLGLGLRWLTGRWMTSNLIGAVTTLVIETLQFRYIPGRDASLGDLLANTLGTMLGAWLAVAGLRWLNASSGAARRLAAASGLITSGVVIASASLLQPMGTTYRQWVQWAPAKRNMARFQGQVNTVNINGRPVQPTDILPPNEAFDTAARAFSVRATVSGQIPPTDRQAIVIRIANSVVEGFALGQWGESAWFRANIVATRLKLRPVTVGLQGVFTDRGSSANESSQEVTIEAQAGQGSMVIRAGTPEGMTQVTLRKTVGLAWAVLLPWDVILDANWWPVNAAWLAVLFLPVAYFSARSRRAEETGARKAFTWWPMALSFAAMFAAPAATGVSQASAGEWLGILCGIVAGAAMERWTYPGLVISGAPR